MKAKKIGKVLKVVCTSL